eukprot:5678929-Prymnesium_polylepis.1
MKSPCPMEFPARLQQGKSSHKAQRWQKLNTKLSAWQKLTPCGCLTRPRARNVSARGNSAVSPPLLA